LFKVLVTGDREWTNRKRIRSALEFWKQRCEAAGWERMVVIHGCARGADTLAGEEAKAMGLQVVEEPANWPILGKAAGVMRNTIMLEEYGPHLVLAFHDHLQTKSKGTKDMVSKAVKHGVRTLLVRTKDAGWVKPKEGTNGA
jgi:hypothetical protein